MEENKKNITRRIFIKDSAVLSIGAGLAFTNVTSSIAQTQKRSSIVTGKWDKKLVGYYSNPQEILEKPRFMDALQKQLGVNVILMHHPLKYTPEILQLNPLKAEGGFIGNGYAEDDSKLNKCIEEVHRRGMDFWLYFSGMHGAEKHKKHCAVDFSGVPFSDLAPTPYAICQTLIAYCPSRPDIREWNRASYNFGASNYNVDGVYVTHFRYANPSFFGNIFGCACPFCQAEAARKGYNFAAMKKACLSLQNKLKRLKLSHVKEAAKLRLTLMDFISILGEDQAVFDWLYFRASVFGDHLKLIRNSIHATTGKSFVTDTHPATMALYVGHNYADLQSGASDGLMPLGWLDPQMMSAVASWSALLCKWVPGLDEPTSLQVVKNFFGYGNLPLPKDRIDSLGIKANWYDPSVSWKPAGDFYKYYTQEQIYALYDNEITKLRVLNTTNSPAFPIIKGKEWARETCERLIARCMELGHTGYVFQWVDNFIDPAKY